MVWQRSDRSWPAPSRPGGRIRVRCSSSSRPGCSRAWRSTPSMGCWRASFTRRACVGGYLNEIGDVVSDAALYAPFALVAPFGSFDIGLVIVLSIVTEFAGALGPAVGASRRYDGPMGKSDRAVVFGALGLWVGCSAPMPAWLGWAGPMLATLLVLTVVNRVRAGIGEQSKKGPYPFRQRPTPKRGTALFLQHAAGRREDLLDPRWRRAVLPALAGHDGRGARHPRHVPSRPRTFGSHGAPCRRARPAGLCRVRLGCARPGPLARRTGIQPGSWHVGARRPDLRRTYRVDLRRGGGRHRGGRPERRRGAGRRMGPRLRAEHPLHGARLAGVPGQALRAVRAQRR